MTLRNLSTIALGACLFSGSLITAADDDKDSDSGIRRPSIGFRVESFRTRMFSMKSVEASTTNPIADYTYTASTSTPRMSVAPTVEYRIRSFFSVSAEVRFHHAEYQQVTDIKSGIPDPNSSYDDRKTTTITETSTANYWEFPFMAHYYGHWRGHWWGKLYGSGGLELRHVGRVRTGTDYAYADGTSDYNEIPSTPTHVNQLGFVAGLGIRYIPAFNIKLMPEIRYVRWQGTTFQGVAFRSAPNQVEAGIGLSF